MGRDIERINLNSLSLVEEDELYCFDIIGEIPPFKFENKRKIKDLSEKELMNIAIQLERRKNSYEEDYEELEEILHKGNCNKWSDLLWEQNIDWDYMMECKKYEEKIWQIKRERNSYGIKNK